MSFLLDTDVVVHLRDGEATVTAQVYDLDAPLFLSIISRVELESGVYRDRQWADVRRVTLDTILTRLLTIDFGLVELAAYRNIVDAIGYSRPRTSDRMIAATAIVHDLTIVTMNGADYRDVPRVKLTQWASPKS